MIDHEAATAIFKAAGARCGVEYFSKSETETGFEYRGIWIRWTLKRVVVHDGNKAIAQFRQTEEGCLDAIAKIEAIREMRYGKK